MVLTGSGLAQQPTKVKRPVKNPPQFPNIIDVENKGSQPNKQPDAQEQIDSMPNTLVQAVTSLTNEVRTLVQELRSLNLRQQAQLDMLRMTRVDMRIDHFEREIRPVRERLTALETEEQTLYQLMTREGLLAQTANMGTLNRDQTMQQLKLNHEARLRYVQAEKERLRRIESDLLSSLGVYQKLGKETEQRIQAAEEMLRQNEGSTETNKIERKP